MLVKLLGVPDEYAFVDANDNSVPVRVLLVTVFESIAEVFLLCIAGYILSRAGVTDKATQRKLNVINVSLFTPALLFSKVAFSLTPSKLKEMWIIPIGFVVISGLSAAVAWVLSKMFKLKKSQTAFAVCAAMFQNSNSLPIALIQSLVVEVPGLKWDKDDTKDQMLGRALTYLVLYSTLGMMLRWSYGVKLLSQADDEVPSTDSYIPISDEPQANPMQVASPEPLERHPGARETDPFFTTARNMTQDEQEDQRRQSRKISTERDLSPTASNWIPEPGSSTSHHQLNGPYRRSSSAAVNGSGRRGSSVERHNQRKKLSRADSGREFWGLPEAPKRQRIMLPEDVQEDSSSDSEDEEWGSSTPSSLRRRASQPPSTKFQSFTRRAGVKLRAFGKSVNAFMTVPMYAALLSIFIAMIPPLQAGLNKVKPLGQAIKGAGQCSIPVTLVVLGAFFYSPPDPNQANQLPTSNQDDAQKGGYFERKFRALAHRPKSNAYPGENKAVFVAVVSRMIIVPAIMLPFIALIARYDFFEAAEDPVFILAAVLLVSSPPALTLAQITQAASGDAFERLISKTITWSYAILTPPLTLAYVVIGLVFGRL